MKVIVLDNLDQFILDLSLLLTKSLGVATIIENQKNKIENLIKENKEVKVFIINDQLFDRDSAKEIIKLITNNNPTAQIIARNASDYTESILSYNSADNLEMIGTIISKYSKGKPTGKYIPVSIYKLLNIDPHNLGCDLYIKILKNGRDHYVKRLHSTDQFSKKEILKYIELGLKDFFVPEEQYESFINMLSLELLKTYALENKDDLDFFNIHSTTHEVISERIKLFGVDEITRNLVDDFIKSIEQNIKDEKNLAIFINNIKSGNHLYAFTHSYLIAYFSYQLAIHFEWNSDSAKASLTYLAIFHDISFVDMNLARYHSNSELEILSKKQQKEVIEHADQSAAIIEKFNNIPFGLTQLIREHHGTKDGTGFPDFLSMNVSPMAMMFIVLEEFSIRLLEKLGKNSKLPEKNFNEELKKEMNNIIRKMETYYSKLIYLKTVNDLKELVAKLNF